MVYRRCALILQKPAYSFLRKARFAMSCNEKFSFLTNGQAGYCQIRAVVYSRSPRYARWPWVMLAWYVCLMEVKRQNKSYARSPGVFDGGQSNPGSTWGERHFVECYPSLFSILIPVTAALGLHQIERLSLTKHIKLILWLSVVHVFEAAISVGIASTKSVTDSPSANRCTIYWTAFFPLQVFETLYLPLLSQTRTYAHPYFLSSIHRVPCQVTSLTCLNPLHCV